MSKFGDPGRLPLHLNLCSIHVITPPQNKIQKCSIVPLFHLLTASTGRKHKCAVWKGAALHYSVKTVDQPFPDFCSSPPLVFLQQWALKTLLLQLLKDFALVFILRVKSSLSTPCLYSMV